MYRDDLNLIGTAGFFWILVCDMVKALGGSKRKLPNASNEPLPAHRAQTKVARTART